MSSKKSKRLLKDVKELIELEKNQMENKSLEYRFQFKLENPDDLSIMNIYITQITPNRESNIEKQMDKLKIQYLQLEFSFSESYPFIPPFVRIVTPKFNTYTGHITTGGSICMELLSNQGWSPTCNIENLLRQIILILQTGNAIIDESNFTSSYSLKDAKTAHDRAMNAHGWNKK